MIPQQQQIHKDTYTHTHTHEYIRAYSFPDMLHHRSRETIPVSPPPTYSNPVNLQGLHQVEEDAALIAGQIEFAHPEGYKLASPSRVLLQRAVLRQDRRAAGVAAVRRFHYFVDLKTKNSLSTLAQKSKGFFILQSSIKQLKDSPIKHFGALSTGQTNPRSLP